MVLGEKITLTAVIYWRGGGEGGIGQMKKLQI